MGTHISRRKRTVAKLISQIFFSKVNGVCDKKKQSKEDQKVPEKRIKFVSLSD